MANHHKSRFDVVIYGGTPAGIAAAVAAGRMGRSVALLDTHGHVGGMAASGLGKSDVEKKEYIGGMFAEYTRPASTPRTAATTRRAGAAAR